MLLREVPFPFEKQNASRLNMLSLAGYLQSPDFDEYAYPRPVIHGYRPWLQPRTYYPRSVERDVCACGPYTLPGDLSDCLWPDLLTSLQHSGTNIA